MAIMNPARLSDRILQNKMLRGEIDAFEALSILPDEFEVFYNRCVNAGAAGRVYERRIDFIILHERLGLLAMEVKGGKIRIGDDATFEQYHYKSNDWHSIEPFTQVKVALLELIKRSKADGVRYWIPDDICVLFPGTTRHDLTDKPQSLPAGTLCADDLALLSNLIPTFFSKNRKGQAWKRDEFIDMRRRLQNMPEVSNENRSSRRELQSSRRFNTPRYSAPPTAISSNIKATGASSSDGASLNAERRSPFIGHSIPLAREPKEALTSQRNDTRPISIEVFEVDGIADVLPPGTINHRTSDIQRRQQKLSTQRSKKKIAVVGNSSCCHCCDHRFFCGFDASSQVRYRSSD